MAGLLAPLLFGSDRKPVSPEIATRKCAVRLNDTVRYLIDGRPVDSLAFKAVAPSHMMRVSVLCVNPVDLSVLTPRSTAPGVGAISVWTEDGPLSQLETLLRRINDAQEAHHRAHGTYAATLDDLRIGEAPRELRVTLEATALRWRADAAVARPTSPRCAVFNGSHEAAPSGVPGVVRCDDY